MSSHSTRRSATRRSATFTAVAALSLISLVGCAGGGGGAGADTADGALPENAETTEFTYLATAENQHSRPELERMAEGVCAPENEALPLKIDTVPQAQVEQKLQLLASQKALPAQFVAGQAPATTKSLVEAGRIQELGPVFEELGLMDNVQPGALAVMDNLYGGFVAMPYLFNIEGFFYNKAIYADLGLDVPTTWDELVDNAEVLHDAGYIAFSASGEQGWPINRLISGYLFRSLGPDAMDKIASGEAKLTDPEYVEAAEQIAALGEAGYMSPGISTVTYDQSRAEFLNGKAAQVYLLSNFLATVNDPSKNAIGVESVGFFPFPEVEGGKGSIDQYPANIGTPEALSADAYNSKVGAWVTCIAENYGTAALQDVGSISGFTVNEPVDDIPEITRDIQEKAANVTETVTWFEAALTPEATYDAQHSAAALVTGDLSPADFMQKVQTAQDNG